LRIRTSVVTDCTIIIYQGRQLYVQLYSFADNQAHSGDHVILIKHLTALFTAYIQ